MIRTWQYRPQPLAVLYSDLAWWSPHLPALTAIFNMAIGTWTGVRIRLIFEASLLFLHPALGNAEPIIQIINWIYIVPFWCISTKDLPQFFTQKRQTFVFSPPWSGPSVFLGHGLNWTALTWSQGPGHLYFSAGNSMTNCELTVNMS